MAFPEIVKNLNIRFTVGEQETTALMLREKVS